MAQAEPRMLTVTYQRARITPSGKPYLTYRDNRLLWRCADLERAARRRAGPGHRGGRRGRERHARGHPPAARSRPAAGAGEGGGDDRPARTARARAGVLDRPAGAPAELARAPDERAGQGPGPPDPLGRAG